MANTEELKIVIGGESSGAESALNRIGEIAGGIALEKIGEQALKMAADVVQGSIEAAAGLEQVQVKQEQILKITQASNDVNRITKEELDKLTESLEKKTTFTNEDIMASENYMLLHTKISKEVMPQALDALSNYASFMGTDMSDAANKFSIALGNPENATRLLRNAGVDLDDAQKKQLKTWVESGNTIKAQEFILDKLKTLQGQAETQTKTWDGQMKILNRSFQEMQEYIGGKLIASLQPYLKSLTEAVKVVENVVKGHTSLNKVIADVGKNFSIVNVAVQTMHTWYLNIMKVVDTFVKFANDQWKKHGDQIMAILKVLLPIVTGVFNDIFSIISSVLTIIWMLIQKWGSQIMAFWNQWGTYILDVTKAMFEIVGNAIKLALDIISGVLKLFIDVATGNWKKFWDDFKSIVKNIIDDVTGIIKGFFDWVTGIINGIINSLNNIGKAASKGGGGSWKASGGYGEGWTMVGENGPELVNLPTGSFVHQSSDTRNIVNNNSTPSIVINNPVVRSNNDITALVDQIKRALGRENELVRLGAL